MKLRPEQLKQHLSKQLLPIYLLSSNEPLLMQESCALLHTIAQHKGFKERHRLQVDKNFNWQDLFVLANNMSLFSEKILIELQLLTGKPGDAGSKALQTYANNPPTNTMLLIITPKLDAATQRTKWFKTIENNGAFIQIWPLNANELPNWIAQRLQQIGLQTNAEGVSLLAEYVEGNLLAAKQEIEKLHLLYGDGTITLQQITAAVTDNAHFNIFDLIDIALAGDVHKVTRALSDLKHQKAEPVLILWALAREIRNLISMTEFIEQNHTIAQTLQHYHVWEKRKALIKATLQRTCKEKLYKMLETCAQLDRIIKGAEVGNVWDEFEKLCLAPVI